VLFEDKIATTLFKRMANEDDTENGQSVQLFKPGKDVASQCRSWVVMSKFCKRSFDSRLGSDGCGFYLHALALVEFDQILNALVNRPLGCNVAGRLVKLLPDFEKP
jgi:hypothetical protein